MTVDELLETAVSDIVPACSANRYAGQETTYVTWNYSTIPVVFAESTPDAARHLIQVHLFLPYNVNPNSLKLQLARSLHGYGTTYPSITPAHDKDGQHYVLECEYADGGV